MTLLIGVLALQGDFKEHIETIRKCGVNAIEVRHAYQLDAIDGLIIPGGESTAIAKLTAENNDPIFARIKEKIMSGMPVYGTCMGSIFLASEIEGSTQGRLGLMDMKVRRNAFGPQRASFETMLDIAALGDEPFPCVFIRGPIIAECGPQAKVLARIDQGIVMAEQRNMLVTAFHPEITEDLRVHKYFLAKVIEHSKESKQRHANLLPAPALVAR